MEGSLFSSGLGAQQRPAFRFTVASNPDPASGVQRKGTEVRLRDELPSKKWDPRGRVGSGAHPP